MQKNEIEKITQELQDEIECLQNACKALEVLRTHIEKLSTERRLTTREADGSVICPLLKYCETLDDKEKFERYATQKDHAELIIEDYLRWLKSNNYTCPTETGQINPAPISLRS
jgi:hypothetical protein